MKPFQYKHLSRQICRRIAAMLVVFAAVLPLFATRTEKANHFFIYGADESEQNEWAGIRVKSLPCKGCF